MTVKTLVDAVVIASVVSALALTTRVLARRSDSVRAAGRSDAPQGDAGAGQPTR